MIQRQTEMALSPYSVIYDVVVPKNHKLRILKENIDFMFVYNLLKDKYCQEFGRPAENPVRMFKYILLKCIYDLSDRGLVERAQTDMAIKFFLDLAPESDVIDPSLLSIFRRKRLVDPELMDYLIANSVDIGVRLGVIKSRTLIIDATHTCSKYNPITPIELLRLRSKKLRHTVYSINEMDADKFKKIFPKKNTDNDVNHEIEYCHALLRIIRMSKVAEFPSVTECMNYLEETIGDILDHYTSSKKDSDSRIGHKKADSEFFGYKTHIAMTTDRIITAATITSGEKSDGREYQDLVKKSEQNLGATENDKKIDDVLADGAYGSHDNLVFSKNEGITLYARPNGMLNKGKEFKDDGFELNKDAGMYVCPKGHMAISKRILKYDDRSKGNNRIQFKFDPEKCKVCPLRQDCIRGKAKSRTYSISIITPEQYEQMKFCKTEEFKQKIRHRYMIEAKNSELKNVLGYDKTLSFGINSMKIQGAVTIYASNITRILKLAGKLGE